MILGIKEFRAKIKKSTSSALRALVLAILVFSFAISPISSNEVFADASSELTLVDLWTSSKKVDDPAKTISLTGYISGPAVTNGGYLDIPFDSIHVFGTDSPDGTYSLEVDNLAPVAVEGDPHFGMMRLDARGRPKYNGSAPYGYSISVCAYQEDETEVSCATKSFNSSSSQPNGETIAFNSFVSSDIVALGFPDPEVEKDDAEKTCRTENGWIGYIMCPIVADLLPSAVSSIYEDWIAKYLNIEPELLSKSSATAGVYTYEAWTNARDLANLALVIMLVLVILSQITGYGVSNYGIKKTLPKLLIAGLLVNLSYIVCQIAVDLSNILGNGIAGFIEDISDSISVSPTNAVGGGALLMIAGGLALLVAACVINPGLLFLALGVLLAAILAIFVLAVVLGIRQAAAVVLVVASPLAMICYSIPNLKSLFNKWLALFRGVLIAYPISSLVVYGSAMGGKILLSLWGENSSLGVIGALGATVIPFFFLPKIIKESMGSLTTVVTRLQTNLNRDNQRRLNNTGLARYSNFNTERKRAMRLAGVKVDKNGNYRTRGRFFEAQRSEFLRDAIDMNSREAKHRLMSENKDYFGNRQFKQQVNDITKNLTSLNLTPDQINRRFDSAIATLPTAGLSKQEIENQRNNQRAMVAALSGMMGGTKAGRAHIEQALGGTLSANPNGDVITSIAAGVKGKDLDKMGHSNPYAADYLRDVRSNGFNATTGTYDSRKMSEEMVKHMAPEDWGKYDNATRERMINDANSDPNSAATAAFNQYMEEVADNIYNGNTLNEASPEAARTENNISIEQAKAYNDSRNLRIEGRMNAMQASGTATGDLTGVYNDDFNFYSKQLMDAGFKGDLDGMEAAYRQLNDRASAEIAGLAGPDAVQAFQTEYSRQVGSMFDQLVSSNNAASFAPMNAGDMRSTGVQGEIRAATIKQVGLLRSRLSRTS